MSIQDFIVFKLDELFSPSASEPANGRFAFITTLGCGNRSFKKMRLIF